ncbi:MAG: phosphocholine cytidylyltransferase family protein [Candidatus Edwardsbacteria bacterium]
MQGLILAAGNSRRLQPFTNNIPKCLLPVGKETILGRTLKALENYPIKEIVIVVGYLKEKIKEYAKTKFSHLKVRFVTNKIYAQTNNIYSLWLAKEIIQDDFLMLDSDILFHPQIIGRLLSSNFSNALAIRKGEIGTEDMKVSLNGRNLVRKISKTIRPKEASGESIGIELFSRKTARRLFEILDQMIENESLSDVFYEMAFQRLIEQGIEIYGIDVGNLPCIEIDTLKDLKFARNKITPLLEESRC